MKNTHNLSYKKGEDNVEKIMIFLFTVVLVTSALLLPANACSSAYYGWTWASSVDTTALDVKIYSDTFYHHLSASTSVFVWNNISSDICIAHYIYSGDRDMSVDEEDINLHASDLTGSTIGTTHLYRKNIFGNYVEVNISSATCLTQQASGGQKR